MSTPQPTIRRDTRVFISAVTRELGSVRKLVKKGLEDNDHHAVEQDNFPPDYRDLIDKLRQWIASCDAVVHVAGLCYGAEPPNRPDDAPRRSYAQLEYEIAVELGKPVYVFLTGDKFPTDPHEPESPELCQSQMAHRNRLTSTGKDYNATASPEQLDQKIRSIQLKVERLGKELQTVGDQVGVTGGRLARWLILVAALSVATLGAVGYLIWRQQDNRRIEQLQREFAERFLQQLLGNKEITAEDARERALKELPALVNLPPAEIEALIEHKIGPRATALDRARAALANRNYFEVFKAAGEGTRQGRELLMLEGTAALAQFRKTPNPEWNTRALTAFKRAMALADPNSATEREPWTKAALSAASVLSDLARYAEAEPLLRQCLLLRESEGPSSPAKVAVVLNNLALLLKATNRPAEAEPLMRRALAIAEKSYGPDQPNVSIRLNNLATLLQATNRMAEAEPLSRRALAIDEKSYGLDHRDVATDINNLAQLLEATNRMAEAEPMMRRALAIHEKSYGPDHPSVARALNNLAWLLKATNRMAEAELLMRRRWRSSRSRWARTTPRSRLN